MDEFLKSFASEWDAHKAEAGGSGETETLDGDILKYHWCPKGLDGKTQWVYVFKGYPIWLGRVYKGDAGMYYCQTVKMFRQDLGWWGPISSRGKAAAELWQEGAEAHG